jgi:hypothetical protein
MKPNTEFTAILAEHRRLRLAAQRLWHDSPGHPLSEVMVEVMMDFWREHPEWAPFNVRITNASTPATESTDTSPALKLYGRS